MAYPSSSIGIVGMTDLERLELALYRTQSRVVEQQNPPDVMTFLRVLIEEVTRQNNIAVKVTSNDPPASNPSRTR